MPTPDGGTDQQRPSFNNFEAAAKALRILGNGWNKYLVAHKKAARAKK